MLLFCHLTSGEHMIKGICDFVSGSPSTCFTTLLNLMLIGLAGVDIYIYIYIFIYNIFISSCDITRPHD